MKFNKDQRLITAYRGCVHADSDVRTALYLLKDMKAISITRDGHLDELTHGGEHMY